MTRRVVVALIAGLLSLGGVLVPTASSAAPSAATLASAPANPAAAKAALAASTAGAVSTAPVVSTAKWNELHNVKPAQVSPPQAQAESASHAHAVTHLAPALYSAAGVPGATPAADGSARTLAGGAVEVTVSGAGAASAVRSAAGRVLASADGAVTATVSPASLVGLAGSAGVDLVAPIRQAYPDRVTAESVHSSMADVWQSNGSTGAGAVVAVIDEGFANLGAEITAGNLPASTVVNGNHCADVNADQHGTAVAEIVHQMAPGATVLLYCVDDTVGLAQAATEASAAGARIVSCSLGFAADARGDGTGFSGAAHPSAAVTVARMRKAGILWVNAAGNSAQDHWAGTFADRDNNGWADLNTAADDFDQVLLSPGDSTEIELTWDQWPASTLNANLRVDVFDADTATSLAYGVGNRDADLPTAPVRAVSVTNTTSGDELLDIRVSVGKNISPVHYDLSYLGDVSASYYSSHYPARAAAGSVTEPASSPYALAVGAAFQVSGALEAFSSRGPTLDGRAKPDIIGFDGVSSNLTEFSAGFYGTSAAAPNVAGAAALVEAANPTMDASQVEAFLYERASTATNPPTNVLGHGVLNLQAPTGVAPDPGSKYTSIAPVRVLDTRSGTGGRKGPVGAAGQLTVSPPAAAPADATALVINLTGAGASGSTYLSVYPGRYPGTSNLNLSKSDPTAAVSATVALDPASHTFKVRNAANLTHIVIDVLGYYSPTGDGYGALAPFRALDTRTALGGHRRKVAGNEAVRVSVAANAQIPANASAVVVNLTATGMSATGFVSAAASTSAVGRTSSLNYSSRYPRANLAVVGLSGRSFVVRNSGLPVDLVVDVLGYYSASAAGRFHALPSPVRLADTRSGTGGRHAPLGNGTTLALFAAGLYGVPYRATAIAASVLAVPSGAGVLSVYPSGQPVPPSSTLNYSTGRVVPNAVVTGVGAGTFVVRNAGPSAAVVVDEVGYFSAT